MLGTYVTVAGQVGNNFYADHNGGNGNNVTTWFGFYGHGGTYYQTNVAFEALRANLGWSPSSGANNRFVYDGGASGGQPITTADATSVIDWNDNYNATASSLFPSSTLNGTAYQINSATATLGTHERGVGAPLAAADPKYLDSSRRFDTWASRVKGQASSYDGVKAAMWSCQNVSDCITSAYSWIRQGYQPTNMALKGAAHDGYIIGVNGNLGTGYTPGTCTATITNVDAMDLVTSTPGTLGCTINAGTVPVITVTNPGAHYLISNPATVLIRDSSNNTSTGLTVKLTPMDIGPVPIYNFASVAQ
jgi:hypothetical protein